ncbi:MAG: SAM-dependent DNA methyltransferase [Candidatus Pacebacteria bacterium]|nr:SAM-dependent DNA methyltransferase [Candidatus Paceibacterota bacterium]MBP9840275.1 SAM-dependent DNA methyltransferase [Candidatus Paceibacterota bacterium]
MALGNITSQVISKQRVSDHGEVLTAEREVNAMLDMVRHETERIDSRFLEPACGTGNFLAPVYEKKLAVIKKRYGKSQLEFERYAVTGTGSIYGVDILEDNIKLCRKRLFDIFNELYTALYKKRSKDAVRSAVRFVLNRNILWGDALSLKTVSKQPMPIVFSEWSMVRGSMMKRRDFSFEELMPDSAAKVSLFKQAEISDLGTPAFIPTPVKEYPLTHFLSLHV